VVTLLDGHKCRNDAAEERGLILPQHDTRQIRPAVGARR